MSVSCCKMATLPALPPTTTNDELPAPKTSKETTNGQRVVLAVTRPWGSPDDFLSFVRRARPGATGALRRAAASSSPASRHAGAAATFWFRAEGSDTRPALPAGPAWARRRPVTPWLLREPPLTASLTLARARDAGSIIAPRDDLLPVRCAPPSIRVCSCASMCLRVFSVWLRVLSAYAGDILHGAPQSPPEPRLGPPKKSIAAIPNTYFLTPRPR